MIGSPHLAFWNNVPTSAPAADDIKIIMMFEKVRTAPLYSLVLLKLCDIKKTWNPERIIALIYNRYDASLCMRNVMLLA